MRLAFVIGFWLTLAYQYLYKGHVIGSFMCIGIGIVGELMFIRIALEQGLVVHHRNPIFKTEEKK